jgi:hypothetical protein
MTLTSPRGFTPKIACPYITGSMKDPDRETEIQVKSTIADHPSLPVLCFNNLVDRFQVRFIRMNLMKDLDCVIEIRG